MGNRQSQSAFTLAELLVVIGLVAVVLLILYPIFHRPRDEFRMRRDCQSNMKQLGLAFVQYTQDADEKFPAGVNAAGNGWAGELYAFTKSNGVYQCPDDQENGSYVSYAENQNLAGLNANMLSDWAATVELYELSTSNCDPSGVNVMDTVSATGINAPQNSTRHDDGDEHNNLNFLDTDGHVKFLAPNKISNGATAFSPKKMGTGPYVLTFAVK